MADNLNFIHDFTVHNTPCSLETERAQYAHYAVSANWLHNSDDSHYHFEVKNLSAGVPLYAPAGTIIYNNYLDTITPKFDSDESVPVIFQLDNNVKLPITISTDINAIQQNYYMYRATAVTTNNGTCTEYMGLFNGQEQSNQMARIPFRFAICFGRKTGRDDPTPDFDSTKPIARIRSIGNISVDNLLVTGPAYILGSCMIRRQVHEGNSGFPYNTFRANSREMFFYMNTDLNSDEYCSIYICPTNCKVGVNAHSLYHCSYTPDQCRNLDYIEVEFNTVLYITFR